MKDAYEVLKQKEAELDRVSHEIESLRMVASLLVDDADSEEAKDAPSIAKEKIDNPGASLEPTGSDALFSSMATPRARVWSALKRTK
jgi:hypothetical protein